MISLPNSSFNVGLIIKLTCDQNWGTQNQSDPQTAPRTHIVQSRTSEDYYAEANGYKVFGKKIVSLDLNNITIEYLQKTRIRNVADLALTIEFVESVSYNSVGSIGAQIVNGSDGLALMFQGKLTLEDPFLEGHLHQYGDISRAQDSIGFALNSVTLKPDVGKSRLI